MVVDSLLDFFGIESSISERSANGPREGWSVERWEYRPLAARWLKRLVQSVERITCLWRERRFLVGLILAEDDERTGVEIDIAPPKPAAALVVWIAKDLPAANA
jgi:hypothetical protein